MDLDRIDFEIIATLQNNARISNKELAAIVDLAPSSTLLRVRKLEEAGVIAGYTARIDPKAVGIKAQAILFIALKRHSRETYRSLYDFLLSLEEVVSVYHLTGETDLLVHVALKDNNHLRDIVVDKVATRDEVSRCYTSVVFNYDRTGQLPIFFDRSKEPLSAGDTVATK